MVRLGFDQSEGCTSRCTARFHLHGTTVDRISVHAFVAPSSKLKSVQFSRNGLAQIADQISIKGEVQIDVGEMIFQFISCRD